MKTFKDKFLNQDMSWLRVIRLAVISAVITAVFALVPFLKDTSFNDMAVYVDYWIPFALFIILNCKDFKEAAIKTFIFFLISQPLIYLLQVPFNPEGFGIFRFYKRWFVFTLLTIPGAVIAYQLKRKNWLSVLVLICAFCLLGYMAVTYYYQTKAYFPRHLLSIVICLLQVSFYTFGLFEEKNKRLALIIAFMVIVTVCMIILRPEEEQIIDLNEGKWTYTLSDDSIVEIEEVDENTFKIFKIEEGYTNIVFTNEKGEIKEYGITITSKSLFISAIEY